MKNYILNRIKLLLFKKRKKAILLRAKKPLVKDAKEDTSIPITINAYAVDDKKKINIYRKAVFIYPSKKHLEEKLKEYKEKK